MDERISINEVMAKATDAEIKLRIQTVYEMVLKGATRPFIIRYASKNWGIGDRQVDNYLAVVEEEIHKTFSSRDKEKIINDTIAKLSNLFVKNYTIEDFRECRNILESRSKLLGLNESEKVDITKKDNTIQAAPTLANYVNSVADDWLQQRTFIESYKILEQIHDFCFDTENKILLLSMPQGSGKSYIANKVTEWLLGCWQLVSRTQSNSIMRVCNTDSNVTKFQAAISNEIMGDAWSAVFGNHKLSNNNKNGMRFDGSWNDNAFFTSAKSSVMSRRADFLIFDDLYASMGEALSHTMTADYIMKFQTMWRGRLKGSEIGKIIMVGTRYAKNDFYQQVVNMYPDSSVVITVPAIDDNGKSFCEETHPIDELLHDRDTMNIDLFNAIYQQEPTAEGFINPFKDWTPTLAPMTENQFDYTCTVADPSFGVGGDFFMVGKFGYNRNGQAALLDLLCERVCSDEMYIQFIEKANCNRNFIEGNGVGGMLIKRVCNITRAPLFPFTSIGNKIERIYMNAKDIMKLTFSDKIENIPFDQMTDFGTADHDDFPDMLSHFFNNIKIYGK